MLKRLLQQFFKFPFFIQVILLLCVSGMLLNTCLLIKDLWGEAVLWRLHAAFFLLYSSQILFIFHHEKYVGLLTLVQGILALFTSADFIFVPVVRIVGSVYYSLCKPSVEAMKQYQYIAESALFTLQLASAYYLWAYFKWRPKQK